MPGNRVEVSGGGNYQGSGYRIGDGFVLTAGHVVYEWNEDKDDPEFDTGSFRKDRKTPIGDRWFCLNFGNIKMAYLGGGRNPAPGYPEPPVRHAAPTILKDNMLILNTDALVGPDLWADPQIRDTFFVSDRLAKALEGTGVARAFGLKKCQVETASGAGHVEWAA